MSGRDLSMLRMAFPPLHPEAWRFVPAFAVVALALFWAWQPLGWLGVMATIWCIAFFRDPDRVTPTDAGILISPADGMIQAIGDHPPPPELAMGSVPMRRISVFMNVFNVHVNRAPAAGRILGLAYVPGRFFNAALDKASLLNERMAIRMALTSGEEIVVVQIAGLVARRIRCDVAQGQEVLAGQRFGMIRFGSRVDVYLPPGYEPRVLVGQIAVAGETILAESVLPEEESAAVAGL